MFLSITERQLVGVEVGYTHASSVMPVVSRSEVAFGTVTCALVPLNTSALPNLPAVVQVAPLIVPVLPLPERSATVVPAPSLKVYAATRPACAHDRPGRNRKATQRNTAANLFGCNASTPELGEVEDLDPSSLPLPRPLRPRIVKSHVRSNHKRSRNPTGWRFDMA